MNILQSLKSDRTFCVTLNNNFEINTNKIIKEIVYHHPLFTKESVDAQNNKNRICGQNNTYFAEHIGDTVSMKMALKAP